MLAQIPTSLMLEILEIVFQIQPKIKLNMHNNITNFTVICVHIISKLFRAKLETKIQDKLANFQVTERLR